MGLNWNLGGVINGAMSSIGLGDDFLADSPLGSFLGMAQNKEAKRQFNETMYWNKYMFNNAHQAEVADLEKAGLNPILSVAGGSGATAGSPSPTAHMDNGSAGLGFVTNLIGNLVNLKNARANMVSAEAADKKASAEAGMIDLQKRLLGYSEEYSRIKGENASKYIQMELNKDPRNTIKAIAYGIGDMISEFSNSSTGKQAERTGEQLYNLNALFDSKQVKNVVETFNLPSRMKKGINTFLKLLRVLTVEDSLNDSTIRELTW